MTDRPIIFSGPMVRAILKGRKTQTRRLRDAKLRAGMFECLPSVWNAVKPGDRLWVRETIEIDDAGADAMFHVNYRADGSKVWLQGSTALRSIGVKPSIHMPRWASRLTLQVTDVKVERLQDITPANAIAEGVRPSANSLTIDCDTPNPVWEFRGLWNTLHGPGAWDANPFVIAITFSVQRGNIDHV